MHTGDAEERELFERLEREFAHVRAPRRRDLVRPPRQRGRMPRSRRLLAWVVVLATGLWFLNHTEGGRSLLAPLVSRMQLVPVVPDGDGEYVFLSETPSGPVRWSSCRPIEVVVNGALQPGEAGDVVERGLAEVAEASGLTITVTGTTDEAPSEGRPAEQPRYGMGWAPVLVAWTTPELDPGLSGDVVGMGGASISDNIGFARYVSGQITLDAPQVERILARPGGDAVAEAVVVHEMAHVLGLGHVDSPWEVMSAGDGATELGPGDRSGLEIAGSGPCV